MNALQGRRDSVTTRSALACAALASNGVLPATIAPMAPKWWPITVSAHWRYSTASSAPLNWAEALPQATSGAAARDAGFQRRRHGAFWRAKGRSRATVGPSVRSSGRPGAAVAYRRGLPTSPSPSPLNTTAVRIWDLPTRVFHVALAVLVTAAIVTAEVGGDWMAWHLRCGEAVLALLAFRWTWGLVGGRWSRLVHFLPTPARLARALSGRATAQDGAGHSALARCRSGRSCCCCRRR